MLGLAIRSLLRSATGIQRRAASVKRQIEALLKIRKEIVIEPRDVQESVALGDGPGGQAVNKTMNAVRLLHVPSGAAVRSHKTRSLALNRRDAYARLRAAVDNIVNGEASLEAIANLRERARKHSSARKSRAKHKTTTTDV